MTESSAVNLTVAQRGFAFRFESLGGTGPDGGCEFGCFQRFHNAEPLGLFRWATVTPAILVDCLNRRFEGMGEVGSFTVTPHAEQWEIIDTVFGTSMHSFVRCDAEAADAMVVKAGKRTRFLKDKLLADLRDGEKTFVLKIGSGNVDQAMLLALGEALRAHGPANLLCVLQADAAHPNGSLVPVTRNVHAGYIDFKAMPVPEDRMATWNVLCNKMLAIGPGTAVEAEERQAPAEMREGIFYADKGLIRTGGASQVRLAP